MAFDYKQTAINALENYGRECYQQGREDVINEVEKYLWHDLRKYPSDLPRKDGLYCVAVKYDAYGPAEVGFGQWENMYGYGSGWSALMPNYGKVIAWKELEPFEED